jgi:hypothetical protein
MDRRRQFCLDAATRKGTLRTSGSVRGGAVRGAVSRAFDLVDLALRQTRAFAPPWNACDGFFALTYRARKRLEPTP